jgi:hypothetical protein
MATNLYQLNQLLVGNYKKINSYTLQHQDNNLKLIIGKNYKSKITDKLLLYFSPDTRKTYHISALVQCGDNVFYLDTYERYYLLYLNIDSARIELSNYAEIEKRKIPYYNNIREF